jgi:hypothetical protein
MNNAPRKTDDNEEPRLDRETVEDLEPSTDQADGLRAGNRRRENTICGQPGCANTGGGGERHGGAP